MKIKGVTEVSSAVILRYIGSISDILTNTTLLLNRTTSITIHLGMTRGQKPIGILDLSRLPICWVGSQRSAHRSKNPTFKHTSMGRTMPTRNRPWAISAIRLWVGNRQISWCNMRNPQHADTFVNKIATIPCVQIATISLVLHCCIAQIPIGAVLFHPSRQEQCHIHLLVS